MGFKNKQVGNERMEILGHAQMFTPNTGAPKGLVFTTLIIVVVSFGVWGILFAVLRWMFAWTFVCYLVGF